ncbi:IS110 family transposase [Streptomyces acidiscabies]|uniref:IS110 family transposase n=1 Tax=Streptomyces acidiscabies TaxID=42234 RepID=A0AAP6BJ28_9ACTN|nr:IS110 family transposase [Streptomyces acidiscabies]MBP5935457.1 IS110 family transposase [Streptomyces sp. LBUM 1476]MBZ3916683.1 IS110 family transposase [Streptomyces acidiscabies]MDX2965681.1 IS110 family transposase [Streptomyces acidiscabies]MDX3024817.1 IS110 family transposase [Streptomyces acidiscabies]MDX3795597.1 IS110 family transposase [Streptomyces acidiscabies]
MLFAGCDWADRWLDFAVVDAAGSVVAETRIVYTAGHDPVAEYRAFLSTFARQWRATVTGIEDTTLPFARALASSGMAVVHVDPFRAARQRAALGVAKSDRADARMLAAMVRAGSYRAPVPGSSATLALRAVARSHRAAAQERTEALHRLRAGLVRTWPAAVGAWPASVGGLRSPQALAVLAAAPGPRAASRLTRAGLADLVSQAGRVRAVDREAERLRMLFCRPVMLLDPDVEEAEAIRIRDLVAAVQDTVRRTDRLAQDMEIYYGRHPHHSVLRAVPGIGATLGAHLLAEIGDAAEQFPGGRSLAAYAGVSPVTWASGTICRVSARKASSTLLRATLHQAAFSMASHSPGAHQYYRRRRAAGDAHATALRKTARRLVLCLYHCMAARTPYDDGIAFSYDPDAPGAPDRPRRTPPLSEAQICLARGLLDADTPVSAVAKQFDVSPATIHRHVLGRRDRRP